MIVAGEDRTVVVQGVAGAGKSTMLQAVARVSEAEGKKVLGLAFQNKMVADLKEGAGIEAQTIASFIWHNEAHLTAPGTAAAQSRRDELRDTTIVVDETSMVSSDDMMKLLAIAEALGIEKVAMVGDRQQLSSIDAGKAFAMAQAGGAVMARMDENIRQRTDTLRTVAALANVGKSSQALRVLGDSVVENDRPAEHAADLWLGLSAEDRAATAVFASGRDPLPLLKLLVSQSNCFLVVDRGEGFDALQRERQLAAGGAVAGAGNAATLRAADYLLQTKVLYSDSDAGGSGAGLGSMFPGGLGFKQKVKSSQTLLTLVEVRTGIQQAVATGSARKKDLSIIGGGLSTSAGVGALGGSYTSTDMGKVTTLALLDAFRKLTADARGRLAPASAGSVPALPVGPGAEVGAPASPATPRQ